MPFTTYAELKALIADYLARGDLTAQIPDFIRLAEVKFNRVLRTADAETTTTLTTDATGAVALPADFQDIRSLTGTGATGRVLNYLTPAEQFRQTRYNNGGQATGYSVTGGVLHLVPASGPVTLTLTYAKGITPLSDANPVNWLLTKHPDAYLYGALAEAEPFLKNDARIGLWKGLLSETVSEVISSDARARWNGGRITLAGPTP